MRLAVLAASVLASACALAVPKTEVMFFFDAEDYTSDRPNDALRDLANLFTEEGARVHVALVGYLAHELERYGRKDVLAALRPHVMGTQSMYHSKHPNVLELADGADYEAAYRRVRAEEEEGVRLIRRVTGKEPIFAVPPGDSKSYVAMDVYADLGLRFYCDTVCVTGDGGDWFANLRHFDYAASMECLIPAPGETPKPVDWKSLLDRVAARPRQILYLHPCMAVNRQFWDGVNYNKTNACEFGKWKLPQRRAEADTQLYYARLREFIRRLKADGRFTFPTLEEKMAEESPRTAIRLSDVKHLAAHMDRGIDAVESPSWSVADVFAASVKFLRGETAHEPGRVHGFLERPFAIERPVTLKASDLKAAAKAIDLSGFLPASIDVGGMRIGPGDFLRAALHALADGGETVTVGPSDPLAALVRFPRLRDFHPAGTWVFWPEFKDEYTSDRLRGQVWTWRPAELAVGTRTVELNDWEFRREGGAWECVRVPHDWAIAGPFDKEVDKQVVAIVENGEKVAKEKTGRTGSLPFVGKGEYRTTVTVPVGTGYAALVFDGVMSEPEVFCDGAKVGEWKHGYNAFEVELPTKAGAHEIVVRATNRPESSRWYPGAGIIRPVKLVLGNETGVKTWGNAVWCPDLGTVRVKTECRGTPGRIAHRILDGEREVAASDSGELKGAFEPWSPENPKLYTLVTEVYAKDGSLADRKEERIGVRTLKYGDGKFLLNGTARKFKGVCLHHDLGPLGAAFDKDAFRRQMTLLKEVGCDSLRTSHNMPGEGQLEVCDELGIMVMAESFDSWHLAKVKNGYNLFFDDWWKRDIRNLVEKCRNHPSVVMWSIGNEVYEQNTDDGAPLARALQAECHKHDRDPGRKVTQGLSWMPNAIEKGLNAVMDIPAVTYRLPFYGAMYRDSKSGIVLGAETASTISSRGEYFFPVVPTNCPAHANLQCSSYDVEWTPWSNLPDDDWATQDDNPWTIGEFVWTGFDYLGEPYPYDESWPSRSAYFGIFDLAGLPKDRYWLYRSHWNTTSHTLHLVPHWTFPDRVGQVTPVYCYTDFDEAELFVNGKSQGRRRKDPKSRLDRYRLRWNEVVYEPGELKVVAYGKDGKPALTETVRTAGKAARVELEKRRFGELLFVAATIVDEKGVPVPDADDELSFTCGKGLEFVAICNGDATSTESFVVPRMKAFHGQLVAIFRGAGDEVVPVLAGVVVDGKVPAGNVIVEGIEDSTVRLRQDMRDSNDWFYWAFRVAGAEGRTLKFVFTDPYAGGPVSCRGPAVTRDGGRTWSYPCDGKAKENEFTYSFAADEKEVWFYQTFQYYPWQWDEFLKRHESDRGKVFESGVLCKSRKGRDVPKAVFGRIDGKARYRVWLSSRTHCGEAPATYVLEGWLERVFGKDALGAWLRENVEFMVVPFVDYDGVVDGDQGKGRKPHDHNRDYTEFLYPESKAIADWIAEHAKCRIDVAFDHHSPWVRNVYNEKIYQTYHADEWNTAAKRKWGGFVMKHQDGSLDYSTADDFPWGFGWNTPKNMANSQPGGKPLKGLGGWIGDNVTNLLINSTYEIPFANAKGNVVTPEKCRAFGNASAVALRDFLEAMRPLPQAHRRGARREDPAGDAQGTGR